MGERRAALAMRGLLLRYTKGLPRSSHFRGKINRIKDLESLITTMDNYFITCGPQVFERKDIIES